MLGGLFLGAVLTRLPIIVLIAAALAAVFILKLIGNSKLIIRLGALLFSASLIFSHLYFSAFYYETEESVGIIATVEDITSEAEYSQTVALRTEEIDFQSNQRLVQAYIYIAEDESKLAIGDRIYVYGRLRVFENEQDGFNSKSYYTSRGYSGYLDDVSELEVIEGERYSLRSFMSVVRIKATERIVNASNGRVGGLISALLLGERDVLDPDINLGFSRLGISHILALSGMHLVILSALIDKLLRALRISKMPRSIISILIIILYMTLVGFGASVTRAGIMLIIAKLLYIFAGARDSLTSLMVATTLICIFAPCSIFDMSLWLSVFATFGVILATEFRKRDAFAIPKNETVFSRYARAIATAFFVSVFAISAVLLISVMSFSGVSILALPATMIFSPLVTVIMYIGLLLLAIGTITPLSMVAIGYGELLTGMISYISSGKYIYFPTGLPLSRLLAVALTVLFLTFAVLKIKKKKRFVALILTVYALFLCSAAIEGSIFVQEDTVTFHSENGADGILITDRGERAYIDISNYKSSTQSIARRNLQADNIAYLDKYIFTHYTYDLPTAAKKLIGGIHIEKILIPEPMNDGERLIAIRLYEALGEAKVKIATYTDGILVGDYGVFTEYRTAYKDKYSGVLLAIADNEVIYTYLSRGILNDSSIRRTASEMIASSNAAIFGCHSVYYSEPSKLAVISEKLEKIIAFDEKLIINADVADEYPDGVIIRSVKKFSLKH